MEESDKINVWITKYALTSGIEYVSAEVCHIPTMIQYGEPYQFAHREGRDWHKTKDSAIKRAEEMKRRKIAALHTKIRKLEGLRFE